MPLTRPVVPLLLLALAIPQGATSEPQQQVPSFPSEVELITVDAVVSESCDAPAPPPVRPTPNPNRPNS